MRALRSIKASGDPRPYLFVVACALRLAWQLHVGFYEDPRTWEYDGIARNLLTGAGYTYPFLGVDWITFGTPGYPVVLAILHWLSGGPDRYLLVGVAQVVMSASLALVAWSLAIRLTGRTAAAIACIVVAVHPALILYAAEVHELTFESLLAGLVLIGVIDAVHDTSLKHAIRVGVVAGVTALTRPTLALFAALGIAALTLRRPRTPRLISLVLLLALAAPWTIRNAVALGGAGASSPLNCVTLWMGNNPRSGGGLLDTAGKSVLETMPDDLRRRRGVSGGSRGGPGHPWRSGLGLEGTPSPAHRRRSRN